jgi:inosose dehydratase
MKVAGAPISWGVSELPEWGHRMAPDRVLSEMKAIGLDATELGPPGFLPQDPQECREMLDRHGVRLVAGFLATVLHNPGADALAVVTEHARALATSGAEILVLAAALPGDSYDRHQDLSGEDWRTLSHMLAEAESIAAASGVGLAFHPHAGTAVENRKQLDKLLNATNVDVCLDTGHLHLGGTDAIDLIAEAASRISHVHLKDLDLELASSVSSHSLSYAEAVRQGMYRPLGQGDLDIEGVVRRLLEAGYDGWFVLEQDMALAADPEPTNGPAAAARQSLDYFRQVFSAGSAPGVIREGLK